MSDKAIAEAALALPKNKRLLLARKLLESLDEPVWADAIEAGARIAEQRLRRLKQGKSRAIPEAEALEMLFGQKRP